MKIKSVEFVGAIARPGATPPRPLPQVAFSGRSNVGKSSLINRLLGRTRTPVARVSATPGKTQEINFYEVSAGASDERELHFLLVDLPGYGFARAPMEVRAKWRPLIESYLSRLGDLRGVVQLIDARRGATPDDIRMVEYLASLGLPTLFVLTKTDKLKREALTRRIVSTLEELGASEEQLVPFSSQTGTGRDSLLESLESLLADNGETE